MDYSVPIDFLSSDEEDSVGIFNNFLNEHRDVETKTDDEDFTGKVDSDLFIERVNSHVNKDNHTEHANGKDLKNDNSLSKLLDESESTGTRNNSPNSLTDVYNNQYRTNNDYDELESKNMEQIFKTNINDEKLAIINFDDSWKSQYENARPFLDEYQFKVTFYIVCDYINGKNRMAWQQIETLQNEGHEIGSHTMSHENLDQITQESKYNEIVQSKKCIEDKGFALISECFSS
ncbi:MAG: polysaccharide deacetylase family protein [Candidatus Nitrosocosmicus sp.]|nr:polysaccharide deacetylase family protein [Candidatus Nitrosocosmicus sp.]